MRSRIFSAYIVTIGLIAVVGAWSMWRSGVYWGSVPSYGGQAKLHSALLGLLGLAAITFGVWGLVRTDR